MPLGAVVIVGSAGSLRPLIDLLALLPREFPLPIFVAQHLPRARSELNTILSWHSRLGVCWAVEAEQPRRGQVYLVPPGMRLAVSSRGFRLSALPPAAAGWMPSADHLINSLAARYQAHTIAIVLSGMLPAGVQGLRAVNACGGFTMAQSQKTAESFVMPSAAIDFAKAEMVMSPASIANAIQVIAAQWDSKHQA